MSDALKASTPNFGFGLINFDFPLWSSYEHRNWRNLDGILAAALGGFITRGVWTNNTAYIQGDRVTDDESGTVFFCLIAHTSAATGTFADDRTTNPTYWRSSVEIPKYRGTWLTGVAYAPNDMVLSGTSYYYCITPHTSGATFAGDIANWELMFTIELMDYNSQCRLDYVSDTQIKLSPYKGSKIIINNSTYVIPSGGVTLANTGAAANTLYYIYAYMNGTTMALERSATAYTLDATTGIPYKTGDTTRALVGAVYTDSSSQFTDTDLRRGVSSWFNRLSKFARTALTADFTSSAASTSVAALSTLFIAWTDDTVHAILNANIKVNAGSATTWLSSNPGNAVSTRTVNSNTTYDTESLHLFFVPTTPATAVIINVNNSSSTITMEGLSVPTTGYGTNLTVLYNG